MSESDLVKQTRETLKSWAATGAPGGVEVLNIVTRLADELEAAETVTIPRKRFSELLEIEWMYKDLCK